MLVVLPVCKAGSFEGRMCANWVRARARAETQAVVVRFSRARANPDRCCCCTVGAGNAPRWEAGSGIIVVAILAGVVCWQGCASLLLRQCCFCWFVCFLFVSFFIC